MADDSEESVPLDALTEEGLEELLKDEEFLRSSPPEMIAIIKRELAARKGSPAP